ncbi:MAG: anti-sigma F factor [Clostridium sp.]|nr:anti-sigma F factor [Clostridium sp.]MCM1171343.1 anti-sigma F factor [Clostridium sp.]MCM1209422.1 anti-sigma F factor [Ruminococcus sp.]MCM1287371.1 anti-sigma F factor [Clostridium sp.]
MNNTSEMMVEFSGEAQNESFARMVVAAFITRTNPTLEEVSDIKTAVSEAVTNSIIHGYEKSSGTISIRTRVDGRMVYIEVKDNGKGIEDIKKAMEPLYTSKPQEDRSGMGFSFMEAFMDGLTVESEYGVGTIVKMWKEIGVSKHQFD